MQNSPAVLPVALESALLRRRGFAHGFSTRAVDIRPGRPEYPGEIARFCEATGLARARLHQAKQVHGTHVARADRVREMPPEGTLVLEADAWAAPAGHGDVVGVRVADCLPVLVGASGHKRAVAAVHAGWRGLVGGVIQAALVELDELSPGASRVAALGPCIGPCCFEVGLDVAEEIARAAGDASVVARRTEAKGYVDLRLAARFVLRRAGFADADIDEVPGCTRCDAARFFSHRREAEASGRHLAAIAADE